MIRDFFLGFIKIHILHHAKKEPVRGKVRNYYTITSSGSEVLEEAKLKMKELIKEIL